MQRIKPKFYRVVGKDDIVLQCPDLKPTNSFILFIAIGLLAGRLLIDKQVGGICGVLWTNLSGWLSGTWFDLNLVGGTFKTVAYAVPFVHAVNAVSLLYPYGL